MADDGGFGQYLEPLDNAIKPAISQFDAFKSGWDQYLQNPALAGGALSFAAQLAQPPQFGQNGFGQLMEALGNAGQGVRQRENLDRQQQESDSKAALRESQADQATSRAGAAESRANSAGDRMRLEEFRQQNMNERNHTRGQLNFWDGYRKEVKDIQTRNVQAGLLRRPLEPIPTPDDYIKKYPALANQLNIQGTPPAGPADENIPIGGGQKTPGAPVVPGAPQSGQPQPFSKAQPTQGQIDKLKKDPRYKQIFDDQFGPGSAAAVGVK